MWLSIWGSCLLPWGGVSETLVWVLISHCTLKTVLIQESTLVSFTGACHGSNLKTIRWIPVVTNAVRLKKEAFLAWLARVSTKRADRYQSAKRAAAAAVAEAKPWVWEEFTEAVEKDFQLRKPFDTSGKGGRVCPRLWGKNCWADRGTLADRGGGSHF